MAFLSRSWLRSLAGLAVAGSLAACGGGGDGGVTPPPAGGTLAAVVVTLADPTLEIGNLTQAAVAGRDALGQPVALGQRPITWSSLSPAVATITAAGVVSAIGIGTADLRASVNDNGTAREATARLTVVGVPNAPTTVDVVMPGLTFSPVQVVVRQNGTVRYVFPALAHNVIWTPRLTGSPADIGITTDATIARTFPVVGVFKYTCTLHPGMDGEVVVSP